MIKIRWARGPTILRIFVGCSVTLIRTESTPQVRGAPAAVVVSGELRCSLCVHQRR